jgi:hypothetical protein
MKKLWYIPFYVLALLLYWLLFRLFQLQLPEFGGIPWNMLSLTDMAKYLLYILLGGLCFFDVNRGSYPFRPLRACLSVLAFVVAYALIGFALNLIWWGLSASFEVTAYPLTPGKELLRLACFSLLPAVFSALCAVLARSFLRGITGIRMAALARAKWVLAALCILSAGAGFMHSLLLTSPGIGSFFFGHWPYDADKAMFSAINNWMPLLNAAIRAGIIFTVCAYAAPKQEGEPA